MRMSGRAIGAVLLGCLTLLMGATTAQARQAAQAPAMPPPSPRVLLDTRDDKALVPSSAQVTVKRSSDPKAPGLLVFIAPGTEGYPGIHLKTEASPWDLSAFSDVEARIVNTGDTPLQLALRVDNAGDYHDNPWNTEMLTLAPGASGTLKTLFGYSYGFKPGFKLKPNAVVNVLLFTGKTDHPLSFRIESLVAAGTAGAKPAIQPEAVRVKPENGFLLGKDTSVQITPSAPTAQPLVLKDNGVRVVLPSSRASTRIDFKPAVGRWDLRDYHQVRLHLRNDGKTAVTLRAALESNGGPSEWAEDTTPLAPGKEHDLIVPFAPALTPDIDKPATLPKLGSDAVSALTLMVSRAAPTKGAENAAPADNTSLLVMARAEAPVAVLPDWLGKRPPVPGEWVPTLREEFSGTTLDSTLWDWAGENYYDKVSHWSKNNVIVGGGVVRLRYEKKTGPQNDDPRRPPTPYAAGYLNAVGKWAQRYGYFEARLKAPRVPGLWPAFWMMPDRGKEPGRQDTGTGGMEFDIFEHLTRWGPNRYNVAMHWDGYGSDHKANGSDRLYVQPDKDGFLTCGLLWTPGLAVYYCNGREVLRWENPRISSVPETLMFTLPSGGWDNDDLDDARLPADLIVDYVRVWQRKDLASPADSPPHLGR